MTRVMCLWTDEIIKDLKDDKLTDDDISKKYKIPIYRVRDKRRELKFNIKPNNRRIIWTDEMIEDLKNINLTSKDLAKEFGCSLTAIYSKRRKLGIKG